MPKCLKRFHGDGEFQFLLVFVLVAAAGSFAADRPNIVYIMSDDHAAHAIGAYGAHVNQHAEH